MVKSDFENTYHDSQNQSFFVRFVSRTNLVKNYIALVLAAFMNAGLFEVNKFLFNIQK